MKIKFTWQYCIAYIAAVFVLGQLHEMAHLTAAYSVCGVAGNQTDFNLWTLNSHCEANPYAFIPTIFGPVFSYAGMWLGFFLLLSNKRKLWPAAIILVLGNLPFARIFTAAMGSGDETTVLKVLLAGQPLWLIKSAGFILVTALSFPPLQMVYHRMKNKFRFADLCLLCVGPMIIMMLYEFKLLGKVLQSGFMAQAPFLGVADFIYLHTLVMLMIVIWLRKPLFGIRPTTQICSHEPVPSLNDMAIANNKGAY